VSVTVKEDDGSAERAYPIGDYFTSLLGGTFVPDVLVSGNSDADVLSCIGGILKDTGEAIETTRKCWFEETPGQFTRKEKALLNTKINAAMAALVNLRQFMKGQ
jgi:hypothetical protein